MNSDITSPAGLSVLLASHRIVTPFTTASSTLSHSKVYLDLLQESYQMNSLKFDPILNRAGEGGTVSEEDIELCVRRKVIATIPYDKDYLRSASKGTPLVLGKYSSSRKMFRTFRGVVHQFAREDGGI
ncbi:hypothetical protein ACFO8Q_18030 [Effusibacillus consociatus]|uniref:LysR substrate-binding domain-containing protein n=2 Tax=Effusibacillus consociatus TaxID=1117041 RepID=A0ABV9Q405_9BACL